MNKINRRKFVKYSLVSAIGAAGLYSGLTLLDTLKIGEKPVFERTVFSLGTDVSIKIFGKYSKDLPQTADLAFREIELIDDLMSVFKQNSDITRLNINAGRKEMSVDQRVIDVIVFSKLISEKSSGVFDLTVLPLLELYGLRGSSSGEDISLRSKILLSDIDYRRLEFDKDRAVAAISSERTRIDLGGIAKGYAVDRAASILKNRGIEKAVINAGGDIYAIGAPDNSEGWPIGIQHPLHENRIAAKIYIKDQSIATSGNYEKSVIIDNKKYGHLVDPKYGFMETSLLSSTVIAPAAMTSDALSTTSFLMNRNDGKSFVDDYQDCGSVFISKPADELEITFSQSVKIEKV
ncbi:FAD:protein FMN transferase [candidate division KSB1 bacterium]